jgi:hypothetical protein
MIYLWTKLQMPSSNISLIVTKKWKLKKNFSTITTVILESTKTILTKVAYLLEIYYHTSVQGMN